MTIQPRQPRQQPPVLLVEANETICDVLRMVLEEHGYAVDEAPQSTTALDCLRMSPRRLVVVLGLWLPNLHSRRVLEAVAADATLASRHAYLVLTDHDSRPLPPVVTILFATPQTVLLIERYSPDGLVEAVAEAAARLTHQH